MEYTSQQLNEDKILIMKLLQKKKYREAREFINQIHMVPDKSNIVDAYVNGMLFMMDMLGIK